MRNNTLLFQSHVETRSAFSISTKRKHRIQDGGGDGFEKGFQSVVICDARRQKWKSAPTSERQRRQGWRWLIKQHKARQVLAFSQVQRVNEIFSAVIQGGSIPFGSFPHHTSIGALSNSPFFSSLRPSLGDENELFDLDLRAVPREIVCKWTCGKCNRFYGLIKLEGFSRLHCA